MLVRHVAGKCGLKQESFNIEREPGIFSQECNACENILCCITCSVFVLNCVCVVYLCCVLLTSQCFYVLNKDVSCVFETVL